MPALASEDAAVLVPGDGPGLLVLDLREFLFRQDRHRQPAHVQAMVLEPAQIHVGADRSRAQRGHKIVGRGQHDDFRADQAKKASSLMAVFQRRRVGPSLSLTMSAMLDHPLGLLAVFGPKARAGAGLRVLAIERAVPLAQHDDSISLFHLATAFRFTTKPNGKSSRKKRGTLQSAHVSDWEGC